METITFPMLGNWFTFSAQPYYEIFGIKFYWYGAIIAVGFLLAALYCIKRAPQFGLTSDNLIDMLIIAVPLAIVCARLYYVIFDFDLYRDDLWQIFNIRNGGLAIYGGVIGGALGAIIVCKVKKIPRGAMLDIGGLGLLIGQTAGRWGNFVNREAYGGVTDIFCRMGLTDPGTGVTVYVHPTFLYESVWNLLGLALLHIFSKKGKRRYDGQLFIMYIGWYGLGRMFIEGLRTDSLYLFDTGIRVSQLLAGASLLVALILLFVNRVFISHEPQDIWVNRKAAMTVAAEAGAKYPEEDGGADKDDDTTDKDNKTDGHESDKI